ncbi:restriction endonuclease subunit S [Roseateles chitinivorans]|uniref:restriction endonuclease subunit S n=1 Tax=Roseateles chitinivorans TaxID=2917965 RepID=UPI003D67BC14
MSTLPKGWGSTTVKNLAGTSGLFVDGDWVESKDQDPNGDIRLLQLADIGDGVFLDKSDRWINEEAFTRLRCTRLETGDVLIARMPDPLGRACLMPSLEKRCVTVVDVAALRVDPQVADNRWVMHTVNAPQLRAEISAQASGTTRKRISRGNLGGLLVPLPPESEQKRIADKIDTVLTRVDAVNTRLARVAPILKRFRQSALAAATSGRLTEDWRVLNSTSKPWRKATLEDLIEEMRNGLAAKPDESPAGRKILRISAVRPGFLDTTDHRYLTTDESSAKLYELRKGDLLFTRYNGSLEYVGVCAMVSEDLPGYVYPDKLIRVRVKASVALPKFIELVSSAAEARLQIEGYVKSSAGQKGISGGSLRTLRMAVPPVEEQTEIVRRVETLFAFADRLEARLKTAQTSTERLTPSLLAKAFRGELVPQDPNDEPASELLRRLQQEAPLTSTKLRRKSGA